MPGKLAERPFDFTLAAFDDPFEDHFRTPGHIEAGQRRSGNRVRAFTQCARHFILGLIVFQRRRAHQRDDRIVAEGNRNRQIFTALFRFMQMQSDIVHRNRLQAELALALHFHAVDADVLLAEVVRVERIARDDARFIEIKTAVTVVQAK